MSLEPTQQEIHARLNELRAKSRDNTITLEETKEAITLMRAGRVVAAATSTASKAKKATTAAKKLPINSDDLLSQLGEL